MVGISGECLIALNKSIENHNLYYSTIENNNLYYSNKSGQNTIGKDIYVKAYTCDSNYENTNTILTLMLLSRDEEFKVQLLDAQVITYLDKDYKIIKWGH